MLSIDSFIPFKKMSLPKVDHERSAENLLDIEAARAVSAVKFMEGGARLEVTQDQIEAARSEMENDFRERRSMDISYPFVDKFDIENIVRAIKKNDNNQLRVKVIRTDGTEEDDWVIAEVDRKTEFLEVRQYYFDKTKRKNAYNRKQVSLAKLKNWNQTS